MCWLFCYFMEKNIFERSVMKCLIGLKVIGFLSLEFYCSLYCLNNIEIFRV